MNRLPRLTLFTVCGLVAAAAIALVLYGTGALSVHETGAGSAPPSGTFKYLKSAENRALVPAVTFTDKDGAKVNLASFQGRLTVLNLWATWCGPCVTELPELAKLKAALPPEKFAVVAVDLEKNDAAKVSAFLTAHQADALDLYVDQKLALMKAFTAYALPLTIIVDEHGHEWARAVGPEKWDSASAIAYVKSLAAK